MYVAYNTTTTIEPRTHPCLPPRMSALRVHSLGKPPHRRTTRAVMANKNPSRLMRISGKLLALSCVVGPLAAHGYSLDPHQAPRSRRLQTATNVVFISKTTGTDLVGTQENAVELQASAGWIIDGLVGRSVSYAVYTTTVAFTGQRDSSTEVGFTRFFVDRDL